MLYDIVYNITSVWHYQITGKTCLYYYRG